MFLLVKRIEGCFNIFLIILVVVGSVANDSVVSDYSVHGDFQYQDLEKEDVSCLDVDYDLRCISTDSQSRTFEELPSSLEQHDATEDFSHSNEITNALGEFPHSVKQTDVSEELDGEQASCGLRRRVCDHFCLDLPGNRSSCACFEGYSWDPDNFKCSDIDECSLGMHQCSQNCINHEGSFNCGCRIGFEDDLEVFGSCKAVDRDVLIIYNSEDYINSYSIDSGKVSRLIQSAETQSLDVDTSTDMIYWSNSSGLFRSLLPGTNNVYIPSPQSLIEDNIKRHSLRIDWRTGIIYWSSPDPTNQKYLQLIAASIDGLDQKKLHKIPTIYSVCYNLNEGEVYWLNDGIYASLLYAESAMRVISKLPESQSKTIALDEMSDKIYWADASSHTIYNALRSGGRIKRLYDTGPDRFPLAMDVFENYIYWVTKRSDELVRADKFGRGSIQVLVSSLINPTLVRVYHKNSYELAEVANCSRCFRSCSNLSLAHKCDCHRLDVNAWHEPVSNPRDACNCDDFERICSRYSSVTRCACSAAARRVSASPTARITAFQLILLILTIVVVVISCIALFFWLANKC